jgi:ABC-2 type transport system permease protein
MADEQIAEQARRVVLRVARKEFVEQVRDGRFRALAALVLAVSAVSFAAGARHYADVERQHAEAQRATRAQWLNQPAKNPHSAAHYGVYAFKPKSRLSMVDTGIDAYVGVAAWLEAHKQNEFRYRPAQDRTAVQRFGELTAAEGMLVLLPLFIVLIAFSSFSGEREQGTLRQLLSLGVPRSQLAAGKAAGLFAALLLVLVPAMVMGLIGLSLTAEFGALSRDLPRALVLAALYLAYFAIFLALSLGVSARARSSRLALVVLLSFWFVNSLLVSRAAADLAGALHPLPSTVEFQRAMEAELNDRRELERRLELRRRELMQAHGVASYELLPINFAGVSLQEGEEHGNEVFDRHYGRLFELYERQNAVQQAAGVVAPLLAMRSLSMGLAGTDFLHHRDFVRAAEDYRRGIQRVMNEDIAQNSKPGAVYTAGQELWGRVPDFRFEAPGTAEVLARYTGSLLLLALWLAAAVAFAAKGAVAVAAD